MCSLRSADRCQDSEIIIPEQVLCKGKVIEIDECAFSNLSFITKVVIPEGIVSIGEYAFENCKNLELVVLPQSLKSFGSGAFMHCKKLKSIELPPLVTSISDKTFAHCCALEHIDLRHISFIGESAFVGCNSLGDVAISDALKEVHAASFCGSKYYTHRLKRKDGVVYLGKWVIGCPGLTREYVINRGTVGIARDIFANERHIKHTINPQYDDEMKHFLIALEMPLVPYMGLPQAYFEEVVPASIHYEGTIAEWKKIIKLPGKKRIPAHVVAEDGTIDTYL